MTPSLSWSDLWMRHRRSASSSAPAALPVSLPETRCRYTFNGSAAIDAALEDMQLPPGARVLLPAWCCGAELGPFEHRGCQMGFYDVEPDGHVPAARLAQRLDAQPSTRVVLITHYNGIVQSQTSAIAELCAARGVSLIEDCAHALYSEHEGLPAGSWGTHAVFSMRKTLPLSEGGALTTQTVLREQIDEDRPMSARSRSANLSGATADAPSAMARWQRMAWSFQQGARSGSASVFRRPGRWLTVGLWALPAITTRIVRKLGLVPSEQWLTPDVEGADAYPVYRRGMSGFSRRLLSGSNPLAIREARRRHHERWVTAVQDIAGVSPLHPVLPEGACPLYFLARVDDPARCVARLAAKDIEAFNWWQHLSPQIVWSQFPVSRQLKRTLLALPLHQRLSDADILRMASCLSAAVSEEETSKDQHRNTD